MTEMLITFHSYGYIAVEDANRKEPNAIFQRPVAGDCCALPRSRDFEAEPGSSEESGVTPSRTTARSGTRTQRQPEPVARLPLGERPGLRRCRLPDGISNSPGGVQSQ